MKDGWHKLNDWTQVYTENDMILRAIKDNRSASVYRWDKNYGHLTNAVPVRYNTFRKGWNEGRYEVR